VTYVNPYLNLPLVAGGAGAAGALFWFGGMGMPDGVEFDDGGDY
jgi:hypothetical protein